MAGFFSLDNNNTHNNNSNNNNSSKNEASYQWQHQYYVANSLTTLPTYNQSGDESNNNNTRSSNSYNFMMMMPMSSGGGSGNSNTISCQDCGNQAKKDCVYMRCRTCCKSRGFDCVTHVKSTWVPASVRRERVQKLQQQPQQLDEFVGVNPQPKRRRDTNNSSSLVCTTTHQLPVTTTTNTTTFSGMEVGNFPAEVNSSAVFRCVRVTGLDDNEEEYAYQTAVNIGGHVFKGILYDQGPDLQQPQGGGTPSPTYAHPGGDTSYGGNLTMGPTATVGGSASASAMPTSSSSPTPGFLDPSFYPIPLNAYLPPGTPFFSNPRP